MYACTFDGMMLVSSSSQGSSKPNTRSRQNGHAVCMQQTAGWQMQNWHSYPAGHPLTTAEMAVPIHVTEWQQALARASQAAGSISSPASLQAAKPRANAAREDALGALVALQLVLLLLSVGSVVGSQALLLTYAAAPLSLVISRIALLPVLGSLPLSSPLPLLLAPLMPPGSALPMPLKPAAAASAAASSIRTATCSVGRVLGHKACT